MLDKGQSKVSPALSAGSIKLCMIGKDTTFLFRTYYHGRDSDELSGFYLLALIYIVF